MILRLAYTGIFFDGFRIKFYLAENIQYLVIQFFTFYCMGIASVFSFVYPFQTAVLAVYPVLDFFSADLHLASALGAAEYAL